MKALTVFIDFKIAYDSVNHEKMPQILKAYGIPEKFVDAIGLMHVGSYAKVIHQMAKQNSSI